MSEERMILLILSFGSGLLVLLIIAPLFIPLGMPDPAFSDDPGWWARLQCKRKGHDFPAQMPVLTSLSTSPDASDNPFSTRGYAKYIAPVRCKRCRKKEEG